MASPSTLTRPQFERASKTLITKYAHSTSCSLNISGLKGWSWVEHPVCTLPIVNTILLFSSSSQTVPGLGYLSRTVTVQGHTRNRDSDLLEDDVLEAGVATEDPALASDASSGLLICGQSVAFSPTYQVPVFYFTVHDFRA